MIKKNSLNICSFTFFLSFLISFINSNGEFSRLVFAFDGSGSGCSSAAFFLVSRIMEPY